MLENWQKIKFFSSFRVIVKKAYCCSKKYDANTIALNKNQPQSVCSTQLLMFRKNIFSIAKNKQLFVCSSLHIHRLSCRIFVYLVNTEFLQLCNQR